MFDQPTYPLKPRGYQIEGIRALRDYKHFMLADSPGLGKTIQACEAATKPVLVICPTYLIPQWKEFIELQYPSDSVETCVGTRAERIASLVKHPAWTIVNYEMLSSYVLPAVWYKTMILDESHHSRSHTAKFAKAIALLARSIEYVFLLTGTPVENEPDDLWMQLHIMDHKEFTSRDRFIGAFCKTVSTPWSTKIVGISDRYGLNALLKKYMLRRNYGQAHRELPKVIPQIIKVQPDAAWRKQYDTLRKGYRIGDITFDNAGQVLHQMRMLTLLTDKPKVAINLVLDVSDKQGAVIFCWYKDTADFLSKVLDIPHIDGDIAPGKRRELSQKPGNIIATIGSLSEGVDLSTRRVVVYVEEHYVPGKMEQSLKRLQRERQVQSDEPVRAYYVQVEKSVDEGVHSVLIRRVGTIEQIVRSEIAR